MYVYEPSMTRELCPQVVGEAVDDACAQPSAACRSRIAGPIVQYSVSSSVLTTR